MGERGGAAKSLHLVHYFQRQIRSALNLELTVVVAQQRLETLRMAQELYGTFRDEADAS